MGDAERARASAAGLWQLLSTQAATFLADALLLTAFPLLAVHVTRSATMISTVGISATLPWLVAGLPSGLLVDRRERRRLMAVAALCAAAMAGILAVATLGGGYTIGLLDGIAFGVGCAQVVIANTGSSLLPDVASSKELTRSNARLFAAQSATGQLLGPPLAGLLAAAGLAAPAIAAAACYALAAVILMTWRANFPPREAAASRLPLHRDLASGLVALARHRQLRTLAVITALLNVAVQAVLTVLVLYAVRPGPVGLSRAGYGVLLSAYALGAVAGTPMTAPLARHLGRGRVLAIAIATDAASLGLLALWPQPLFVGTMLASAGVASSLYNVVTVTYRQQVVLPALLGRVTASYRLLGYGALPVGSTLGGLIASTLGVRAVFLFAAATTALSSLGLPRVRERLLHASELDAHREPSRT